MKLVLRLVETGIDGSSRSVDVLEIVGRSDPGDIAALGITLSEGKQLLGLIQQAVVAAQCRDHAARRPTCRSCAAVCQVKDYRPRQIATLFGQVTVRLPVSAVRVAARWRPLSTGQRAADRRPSSISFRPICPPYRGASSAAAKFYPKNSHFGLISGRFRVVSQPRATEYGAVIMAYKPICTPCFRPGFHIARRKLALSRRSQWRAICQHTAI